MNLAPVDHGEDYDDVAVTDVPMAPVFPTEDDAAQALADLIASDPTLAIASRHKRERALADELAKRAAKLSKAKPKPTAADALIAPVFPTEAHVDELVTAIPTILPDEIAAVLTAGPAAFLASVAAKDVVTDVPATEEVAT